MRFFATAKHNGADIRPYQEVIGMLRSGNTVTGVRILSHVTGQEYDLKADLVVNATGAWAEKVSDLADAKVPVQPTPGVMVAVRGRWCNMVVNRLNKPSDGDIIVPQRGLSVIGTTSWTVEDPDRRGLPEDHVQRMFEKGGELIPAVRDAPMRAAWSAARPLIAEGAAHEGRELPRTFKCFDHKVRDGVEGLVTISGGKGTTMRAMAEATADVVCDKLGLDAPCQTREYVLLPYWAYYQ
jgi:glycerol-3-phosphate dehydrogenase